MVGAAFGTADDGSVAVVRHSTEGSAGSEGRHARAVEDIRPAIAGQDIAGGEGRRKLPGERHDPEKCNDSSWNIFVSNNISWVVTIFLENVRKSDTRFMTFVIVFLDMALNLTENIVL